MSVPTAIPVRSFRLARGPDRKLWARSPKEAPVKLRCDNCHHEIKQTPILEARRKFCDGRCGEHWKRRMLRSQAAQTPASH